METVFSRVVNALPGLVWTAQPDGRIDFVSQGWRDYIGATSDLVTGDGWQASLHKSGEFEARLRRHDGQYRWFLFRASPLLDASDQLVGWCGINADIDDRMRPLARAPGLAALRLGEEGFRTIVETTSSLSVRDNGPGIQRSDSRQAV